MVSLGKGTLRESMQRWLGVGLLGLTIARRRTV
jgi:hypothetical protein